VSANEHLVEGLISAKDALLRRVGNLYAEVQTCQNDIAQIDMMLVRYAENAATSDRAGAENEDNVAVRSTPGAGEPGDDADAASFNDLVGRLIKDEGVSYTAHRVSEWLFRTAQLSSPAPVKALLEKFPAILRGHYNEKQLAAVEALRQQIRGWTARSRPGVTQLWYRDGLVGYEGEVLNQREGVHS